MVNIPHRLKEAKHQPNYEFRTLPPNPHELPPDLEIPTIVIEGEEVFKNFTARFTLEVPEEILDPVPLGIVHGWFGTQSSYVPLRNWCARNGKPSFTVEPSRKLERFAGYNPQHLLHPEKLLSQTVWGAMKGIQKMRHIEKRGVDTSINDLMGHSMGGRTGVETALRKPKHVRTMSFNAAAGMEPHSVKDFLLYRIPSFLTRELFPALKNGQLKAYTNPAAAEEFVEYVMAGGLRAVKEGLSIGNCSIRDKAAQLGELGIKTAIYGYRADAMIPIQESLEHSGHLVDLSAIFPYPEVGHLAPQIYPEVVGKAQLEIIDALTGTNKAARHKHLARTAMMSEAA